MLQFGWATACLWRDCAHLLESPLAEGPAARRQDDPFYRIGAVEVEALPDRIMLAVDRQQGRAAPGDLLHDEPAGADEHLLVGEGDDGPPPDCGQGRRQPGRSDDARHYPFGRTQSRFGKRIGTAGHLDSGSRERLFQSRVVVRVGNRGESRPQSTRLLGQTLRVPVRGERLDLEAIRITRQQIDRALTDGAGRPENRHASNPAAAVAGGGGRVHRHASRLRPPIKVSRATTGITASSPSSLSRSPPCPGMRPLEVLHAEPALCHELGKIAELLDNRKARADGCQRHSRRDPEPCRGGPPNQGRAGRAPGQPGPGFSRAPARCQSWPAKDPPDRSKPRYRSPRRRQAAIAAWPGRRAHRAPTTRGRRKAEQPRWRRKLSIAARHLLFCAPPIKPAPRPSRAVPRASPVERRAMRSRPPPERPPPAGSRSGQNGRRDIGVPIPTPLRRRQRRSTAEARANRTRSRRSAEAPAPAPTRRAAPGHCWRPTLAHPRNGRFGIQRDPTEAP